MKKTLVAIAVLAASGAAMAQSSVTLFGTVDAAVTVIDGAERVSGLASSGLGTSALGFRGVEDLGGGAKAEFWLEGAANTDDGTGAGGGAAGPGFEFKRRASLSLHTNWFELRMGRYLTAAYQATSRYDPFAANGIGASRSWAQRSYDVRRSNMVGFYSPNWSGFKIALNSAFGEAANGSDAGSYLGGSLTYDNGPLSLGLSAERRKSAPPATVSTAGLTAAQIVSAQNAAAIASSKIEAYSIGGSYQFGGIKLMAAYVNQENTVFGSNASSDLDNYLLGLTAKVGATGTLKFAYNRYDFGTPKADHYSLGYVQDLSKRTAVYGTYAYMKNKNASSVALNAGNISTAAGWDSGKQHGIQVGARHSF